MLRTFKNLIKLACKYTELIQRLEYLEKHQKELYNLHDAVDEDLDKIEKMLTDNDKHIKVMQESHNKMKTSVRYKSGYYPYN